MDSTSYNYYKYCMVPQCKSTSIKTPEKLFIYVPGNQTMRKKWLTLARRSDAPTLSNSKNKRMNFCEDHFDLPNDMLNYTEYRIMGKVSQVRMKPGCTPSKFECQEDRKKRTSNTVRPYMVKKQRMRIIEECLNKKPEESCAPSSSLKDTPHTSSDFQTVGPNEPDIVHEQNVDKPVQTNTKTINQASPMKSSITVSSTSLLKVKTVNESHPSVSNLRKSSVSTCNSSPLMHLLKIIPFANSSESITENKKLEADVMLLNTVKKIQKKPCLYIGVPSSFYYLIDILKDKINVPQHHILLCLNKIRLDTKFDQLADDYGITSSCLKNIFLKNVPLIASFMRCFIVELDRDMVKKTLPMAFRHNYCNVSCIINCLEIEVQMPSQDRDQALMWSDDTNVNTVKYLISTTPNGLVNYISPGFGGGITDTSLVASCDFVKTLKNGMVVMAGRGFKHIEPYLQTRNISVVRPQSVETGVMIEESQEKLTKRIASLRKNIEKVMRCLREFYMLKPHACINFGYAGILDDIIIIACALINLQDSLIFS